MVGSKIFNSSNVALRYIIARELRELRPLRRDLAHWVDLVFLRFEDVDLGQAAALCNHGAGMVRAQARTGAIDTTQR